MKQLNKLAMMAMLVMMGLLAISYHAEAAKKVTAKYVIRTR